MAAYPLGYYADAMTRTHALRALFAGLLLLGVTACGGDDTAAVTTAAAADITATATGAVKVAPADGAALIEAMGDDLTVIDVRTADEFASGHLQGAANIDIEGGQFSALIAELPRDEAYMVYCHSGRRSAIAAQTMIEAGFTAVYDLGGIVDWQAAGLPVVTG